jgi:hypothetical protein
VRKVVRCGEALGMKDPAVKTPQAVPGRDEWYTRLHRSVPAAHSMS